jgi:hypothetical protein
MAPSKLLLRAALAVLTLLPAAAAHAAPLQYVFVTVDRFLVVGNSTATVEVTGLLEGEATPRTLTFSGSSSTSTDVQNKFIRCEKLALLAMASPGRYKFELYQQTTYNLSCALTRATP